MRRTQENAQLFAGPRGTLPIRDDDEITLKLAMLFEGKCTALGPTGAARKYGYSKQRYYQLLRHYKEGGAAALASKKRGPRHNYRRTAAVEKQVIRYRFLDSELSAEVIAQKLRQTGWPISTRSVERIIEHYGLQKKTPRLYSRR